MSSEFNIAWKTSEEGVPGGLSVGATPKSYKQFKEVFDCAKEVRKIDDLRELRIVHYPKFSPFEYQQEAVLRMLGRFRGKGIFGDQVGLGKTIEVGMTVAELTIRGAINNVLLLCPDRLVLQWQEEIGEKFSTHFEGKVIKDLTEIDKHEKQKPSGQTTMYIMSFNRICNYILSLRKQLETDIKKLVNAIQNEKFSQNKSENYNNYIRLHKDYESLYDKLSDTIDENALRAFELYHKKLPVSMLVVDEADALLSSDPKKTLHIYKIAEHISKSVSYRILLSATPIRRQLNDVFKLIKIVRPQQFTDVRDFIDNYCFGKERLSDFIVRDSDDGGSNELAKLKGIIDQLFTRNRLAGKNVQQSLKPLSIEEVLKIDFKNFADQKVHELTRDAVFAALSYGENSSTRSVLKNNFLRSSGLDSSADDFWGKYVYEIFIASDKSSRPFEITEEKNREFSRVLLQSIEKMSGAEVEALRFSLQDFIIPQKAGHLILYDGKSREDFGDVEMERQKRKALEGLGIADYSNFKKDGYKCDGKFTEFDFLVNGMLKDEKVVVFSDTDDARQLFIKTVDVRALNASGDKDNANYFKFKNSNSKSDNTNRAVYFAVNGQEKGVNMQFCSNLIITNLSHDPNLVEQIVGRISRIGQKKNMHIYVFAPENSLEHYLYKFYNETLGLFSNWDGDNTFIIGGAISAFLDSNKKIANELQGEVKGDFTEDGEIREVGFKQVIEYIYKEYSNSLFTGAFDSYPLYKDLVKKVEQSKEDFVKLIKGFGVQEIDELAWQDR